VPEKEAWVPADLTPPNGGLVDKVVLLLAGYGAYKIAGVLKKMLRKSKPVHE
jgi:hypothetical protein